MNPIDLHTHTTASDGTLTPVELITYAIQKKLSAIAITDHDTLKGILQAKANVYDTEIEIISGIEFSTNTNTMKSDIHILGLYIDETNLEFTNWLAGVLSDREDRNQRMVDKLCSIGLPLTLDEVVKNSTNGVITRAHFANTLLKKGYIHQLDDAYKKYIGNGCVAYVQKETLTPEEAISRILKCGGIPVLAHPTLYNLDLRQLESLIRDLSLAGLVGIEGIYPLYTKAQTRYIQEFAAQFNLLVTGGSDFHGLNKPRIDLGVGHGNLNVPYTILEGLKNYLNK